MATVTGTTLDAAAFGGLINESVMQQIWDISSVPLPLSDAIGTDTHSNPFCEWTVDALQAPDVTNAVVDGADNAADNTNLGTRRGNHSQISTKAVKVSTRAQQSDTVGTSDALVYQIMQRQRELRRDVEAICLTNQASVKDAGAGTPGKSAGLGAWILNGYDNGTTPGGWTSGTGVVATRSGASDASDVTGTETMVRGAIKAVYNDGGESTMFMSTPSACESFSKWLFDADSRVATLQSDVNQTRTGVTATGAVSVFVSDFGTVVITPNRIQQTADPGTAVTAVDAFVIDPTMLRLSYLHGYRTEPLAKTGLADERQMSVDWCLSVLNEGAQAIIANINQNTEFAA